MQRKRRNKEVCGGYDILKRENETVFEVVVFIFEGESVFGTNWIGIQLELGTEVQLNWDSVEPFSIVILYSEFFFYKQ